ncbi:MAG: FAD synthase [Nitrososphaerota archaeon]|jgi:FAD synthetase|nr:FAD synthase [Nitrososphaerota archaeon]
MANQKTRNRPVVVLASGVFDLLHLGHVKFLEEAKHAGGENAELIVIIARDNTVERVKGRKPIVPEDQRRALVESLKVVDIAILGLENLDINQVVTKIKPDIIALGYDQEQMLHDVETYLKTHNNHHSNKLPVKIVKIGKFEADALDSSSKIKQKIVEKFSR